VIEKKGPLVCAERPAEAEQFHSRPHRPIASTSQPLKASPAALAVLPDIVGVPLTIIRTSEAFHRLRVTADLESLAVSLEAEGAP
jgi:hypothetical protein